MKKLLFFFSMLTLLCLSGAVKAQSLADYIFSTGEDENQWITLSDGATSIVSTGDDKYSSLTNIGFSFPFGDGVYTQFWANSNGIFSFSSSTANDYYPAFADNAWGGGYTSSQPKICGITQDLYCPSGGYVKYELTGTASNRVLVCEFKLNNTSSSGTNYIMWQVQLHESDSRIVIVYGSAVANPSSYQIGLSSSSSDIWTINPSTHVATHATGAVSTTYSVWPGEYRYYSFMVPTDPYITLSPGSTTVVTGFTQPLTASYGNVTGTPNITYSSSNTHVATVSGSGTTATVTGVSAGTATITATMTYNATDYTATCAVTVEDPSLCSPTFGDPSDDYISNFATTGGETNINNSSTYDNGGYSDYYDTKSASITAGETLSCTITPSSTSWSYGNAIWVDWNGDFVFADNERVAYSAVVSGEWTGEFAVPATTAAGDYHMRVMHYYNTAATNPCISANYGEAEDYKLTVIAASPYQRPVNLHLTNLGANNATLAWEAPNSDVQSYKYQYRVAGGEWNALTSTNALSAPLNSLTGNTAYEFQVQAIYAGNNESAFASTSFTTPCDAYSINPTAYIYGFETAADMDCWELVNGVTNTAVWDNANLNNNFGYEPARNGDYCFVFLYVDYDDTDPEYQTLISPELTDIPANGVHVEFYYVGDMNGSGQETFRVGYSTTDKNLSSFTWGTEITNVSTEYQRFSANYPANVKYVAVQHTSDDQYYLFLDDFTFEGAADCLEPTNVLADNITTTGADITWTNGGEETAWDIYVTSNSTDVPNDGTTPTYANISTKPYPIASLTPATTYYIYVRAKCTENSAWSVPAVFHTECEGMGLPYGPYGFEDGALSVCWNVINTNTSYNYVNVSENNANTGTHSLAFFRGSNTGDLVAVLPEVGAYDLSDYQFEFSTKGTHDGYEITVGIMTDPENLTTFVAQGDVITTTTSYAEYKVRFNEYTGSGKYVAIKVVRPSSVDYGSVYVDDIAINPIPSCIEPEGLTVTQPTPHGATFSWTENASATAWQLYISENSTAPSATETDVIAADANPFVLTSGLNAETEYHVWVRANCGTDGYSTWVGPETFTTGIACPAPTGLAANNITAHTADLSWNGTSDSYVLSVGTYDYTATPITGTILEEDFEKVAVNSLPEGWAHLGAGTITVQSPSSTHVHGGSRVFRFNGTTSDNIAVLPNYGVETNRLTIDFWMKAEGTSSGTFEYGYVTNPSDATTFVKLGDYSASTSTSYQHVENLSMASAPDGARIAFKHKSGSSSWYWFIDDLTITGPIYPIAWEEYSDITAQSYNVPNLFANTTYFAKVKGDCGDEYSSWSVANATFTTLAGNVTPTGLAVAANTITSTQATASWNAVAGNTLHESYDIYWAEATVTAVPEEPATPNLIAGISATSQDITGLDPETEYKVWVRDNCGTDGYSNWSSAVTFTTASACQTPDGLAANSVTNNSATLSWNAYGQTGFNLQYRVSGEEWDANNIISNVNTPYSMNPILTGNTTYQVRVQATCAEDPTADASWSNTVSFTTACDAEPFPWSENFDTWTSKSVCWSFRSGQYNMGQGTPTTYSSAWTLNSSYGSDITIDGKALTMNLYSTNKYWAVTPAIDITTDDAVLKVDVAVAAWSSADPNYDNNDTLAFAISTDGGNTFTNLRVLDGDDLNNLGNDYTTIYVPVAGYNGQAVRFAIYGGSINNVSSSNDNRCVIDNVSVEEAPSCYPVGTLSYDETSITPFEVGLSWTLIDENQNNWKIEIATNEEFEGYNITNRLETPQTILAGLSPETHYWVRVKAVCGDDNYGEVSNTIDFTTGIACQKPTNLEYSEVDQTSALLSWNENGTANNWVVAYKAEGDADFTEVNDVTNPYYLGSETPLTQGTNYTVKVRANCGGFDGMSQWSDEINFQTVAACPAPTNLAVTANSETANGATITWGGEADSYTIEYRTVNTVEFNETYDFDDNTMQGWTTYDEDGDGNSWAVNNSSSDAHSGSYSVRARYNGSSVPYNWLISPQIPLGGTLKFFAKRSNDGSGENFQVYVSTTGTDIADFTAISELTPGSTTYKSYEYDLSSYSGNGYVAIRHTAASNQWYLYVDDINITANVVSGYGEWQTVSNATSPHVFNTLEPETVYEVRVKGDCNGTPSPASNIVGFTTLEACGTPTNFILGDVEAHQASFSWTAGVGNEAWKVYVKEHSAAEYPTIPNATVTTAAATIDELDATTAYDVKIVPTCSDTKFLEVENAFTTPCEAVTIPAEGWTEKFDSYTGVTSGATNNLPICWNYINGTSYTDVAGYPLVYDGSSYSYSYSGNNCLRFHANKNQDPHDQYAVLPAMQNVNTLRINLYARLLSTSSYGGTFTVGVMTDPVDASTFVPVGEPITLSSTNYTNYTINLNSYNGSGNYIAIKLISSTTTSQSIFIDDITVELLPSCVEPSNLQFVSSTTTTATLQWIAGGSETAWDIYYSTENVAPTSSTEPLATANTNPATINVPNLATTYYVWVRAHCSDADQSPWIGGISFTTKCDAITDFPITYGFETSEGFQTGVSSYSSAPTTNNLGNCWRNQATSSNGSNTSRLWCTATTHHDGSQSLMLPDKGSNGSYNTTLLAFPAMNFTSANGYHVSFWIYRNNSLSSGTNYEGFKVYASNSDTINDNAVYLGLYSRYYNVAYPKVESASGWYQYDIYIPQATITGTTYLIFEGQSYYGNSTYVDDITIKEAPSCYPVGTLAYDNESVTPFAADLSWTLVDNNQGAWDVQYATNNAFSEDVQIVENVNEYTDYTLSNLTPETHYYVRVRANCGNEDQGEWSNTINFTTGIACQKPTDLALVAEENNPTQTTANLSWTENGNASAWIVAYKAEGAPDFTEVMVIDNPSYILGSEYPLTQGTNYTVKVRANCGGSYGMSQWSNEINFQTEETCPTPVLAAEGISNITGHTADVAWTGSTQNISYVVSYRTAAYFDGNTEEFSGTSIPTEWEQKSGLLSDVLAGTTTLTSGSNWSFGTGNGVFNNHAKIEIWSNNCKNWLITPSITLTPNAALSFDLALTNWNGTLGTPATTGADDKFVVLISTDAGSTWTILRQWDNADGSTYVYNNITCSATGENVSIDLSAYSGQTVKVAFYGESTTSNADNYLHIDNVTIGATVPAGEWQTVSPNPTTESTQLTGLTAETTYEVKVVGNCDNDQVSTESDIRSFTTTIACPAPVLANPSDITTTTATLTWTGSNASNFTVAYKAEDENEFTEVPNVNGSSFTFDDGTLTPGKVYTVKVKAVCGQNGDFDDGESAWSNEKTFTTPCEAITITDVYSYEQDFNTPIVTSNYNSTTDLVVPSCWKNPYTTGSNQAGKPHIIAASDSYNYSTDQVLNFYGSGNNYITLPAFTNALSDLQISFKWATEGSSSTRVLTLGYITAADDGNYSSFNAIGNGYSTPNTSAESYRTLKTETVYLNNVPAEATRLVFRWYSSDQYSVNIDDVVVSLAPACLLPTSLAVTANGYEATFTWVSDVNNYEVVYSTSATADPDDLTPTTTTDEEFVETMTALGDYYFWVRANCDANGYSEWAGPASVHIGYCVPTLTSNTTTYYISRFTTTDGITNIDNSTTGAGHSYSDFYDTYSATAYSGLTVNFSITIAGGSTHGSAIWVDWNNDMTFSDDERVYHTTGYTSSPHNGSFTVPANTALGDYRMRIVSDYNGSNPSNPCGASTGEFEDYKLTIVERPSYAINATANPAEGGTVTGAGTYDHGTTATLTATPSENYHFVNWTNNVNNIVSTDNPLNFSATQNITYTANFAINSHHITATSNPYIGGDVNVSGQGDEPEHYYHGTTVTLTAQVNAGYMFVNWTKNDNIISTEAEYSFIATEDANYVANYVPTVTITAIANPTEGGNVEGAGTFNQGDNVTLTATPATGYHFVNWTLNDEEVSTETEYTITSVGESADYVANFEPNSYNITADVTPEGSGTVTGAGSYEYNSTATLTATANTGYHFVNWTKGGEVIESSTIVITVTEDANYTVNFALNSYEVNATTDPIGGGSVSGTGTYNHGATATLTATANDHYNFTNWTEGGVEVSTEATYSFQVTGERNLVANFTLKSYEVTVSANPTEGGTVSGAGTYEHGASATLTATANEGYTFTNWTKGDEVVSTSATFMATVTEAAAYVANFTLSSYEISAYVNPIAGGSVSGAGTFNHGATATLTATANTGYNFTNWTEGSNVVSTDATYSFEVTGNRILLANFSLNSYEITATANPNAGGTVSGAGTYEHGAGVTLTATPAANYLFTNWTKGGVEVSSNATYSFTATEAGDYVANFTQMGVVATPSFTPAAGTYFVAYTENQTVSLTCPTAGATIYYTTDGSEPTANSEVYTVPISIGNNTEVTIKAIATMNEMVNSNVATATYKVIPLYNIIISSDIPNGTVSANRQTAAKDSVVILTAEASTGYHFDSWHVTSGNEVIAVNNNQFIMPAGNVTVSASFEANVYTVTATIDPTESGTVNGTGDYSYGTQATLTAVPAIGYEFVRWEDESTNASRVITVTGDVNVTANFALQKHDISATANPNEGGSVTGASTYNYGTTATLTATANEGYTFVNWTEGGQEVSTNATLEFTVTGARTLVANFSLNSYDIAATANPNAGGTVNGAGTFDHGATATLTAIPAENYLFSHWTENDVVVEGAGATYSFTVEGPRSLVAHFDAMGIVKTPTFNPVAGTYNVAQQVTISCLTEGATIYYTMDGSEPNMQSYTYTYTDPITTTDNGTTIIKAVAMKDNMVNSEIATAEYVIVPLYSITVADVTGGTLSTNPESSATMGTVVTLTATETTGYSFNNDWSITNTTNGQPVELVNGNQFTMPAGNVSVNASFSLIDYTVDANITPENSGSVTGTGNSFHYGEQATLTAVPAEGYEFVSWEDQSTTNPRTVEVTDNVTVSATFALVNYSITVADVTGGTLSTNPESSATMGTVVTLTATETTGYSFNNNWSITNTTNGQPVELVNGNQFTMPAGNVSVSASFTINSHLLTIHYVYSDQTSAADDYTATLDYGSEYNVTSPEITGYTADQLAISGTMPDEDVTVTVTYGTDVHTLTIHYVYAAGGTAHADEVRQIAYGAEYSVASPAITGYTPDVATVAGTMGTADVTETVTYTINSYEVSATTNPTEGGNVEGAGIYNHSANANLTANAATGYTFTNWTENGNVVSTDATYSFQVTGERALVANFDTLSYNITASINPTEGGNVEGAGYYKHFKTATLTASANEGYTFVNWTEGQTVVSTDVTYSFEVTSERTLVANFSLNNYEIAATANPTAGGNVTGAGNYDHFATATLTATAATGYTFVNWTDGGQEVSTDVTYSFEVTGARTLVANFSLNSYAVSATANPSAAGTITGAGTYNHGAEVTVSTTVNTGFYFVSWTENGNVVSTSTSYTFTFTGARTLVANFDTLSYNIAASANPNAGGTVEGAGTYKHFKTATLTATPATGYTFINWTEGGQEVSTNATYEFTVTGARTLVANFSLNSYDITATVNPNAGGSVNGAGTFNHGATATLTATAATGYTFVNWTEGGQEVSTNATYEFNVTGARTLVANFSLNSYAVSATANPSAAGTITGAGTYNHGAEVTVSTTVNTGFYFVSWTENGNVVSTSTSYTFTFTGARTLVANFDTLSYNIAASANPNAGGTVEGAGTYKHFKTATLTATPATGYTFINWTEGGQEVSTNATYEFTVTGARTLVANFSLNSYDITATVNPNAGGSVNGAGTFNHGATATLTATAATGYTFVNWTEGGQEVSTNATYEFTVTGARTLVANFSLNSYDITATANPSTGGTVEGTGNYNHFTNATLTATPATGYYFVSWTENGNVVSTSTSYGFEVTGAKELVANFDTLSYNITVAANLTAGGTVSGADEYKHFTTATVTANPSEGYSFTNWTENGNVVSTDASYSFQVTGARNLVANFTINNYNLTIRYLYSNGTTAAVNYTAALDYNAPYNVTSPTIDGYTADKLVVSGNMPASDVIDTVVYRNDVHTLTIHYVYADNTTAHADYVSEYEFSESYSVVSPNITGYTPNTATVSGTMGTEDVTMTVTYTINSYQVNIHYVADGTTAPEDYSQTYNYGVEYSVASPAVTGYTPDIATVNGTMGTEAVNVTVTYTVNQYNLTINYLYTDNTTAYATHTEQVNYNANYSVTSPTIEGYVASQDVVSGVMPAHDVTETVTYGTDVYTLTIHYVYANGTQAYNDNVRQISFGAGYSVNSPEIVGYTPDQAVVSGTMGAAAVEITVTYTINNHLLTINYVKEDNTEAATAYTSTLNYGAAYAVTSPSVTGYVANRSVVSGSMPDENVTVTITYYQVKVNIVDATNCAGNGNGSITVTAPTGNFEYSLNGTNFQTNNIFNGLNANDYTLYIRPTGEDFNYMGTWTVASDITMPTVNVAANDSVFCLNNSIQLNGNGSSIGSEYSYAWTGPANYSSSDRNPAIFNASNGNMSGTYTLTVTNTTTQCASSQSLNIYVNDVTNPNYVFTISGFNAVGNISLGESSTTVNILTPTINHFMNGIVEDYSANNVTLSNDAPAEYTATGDYNVTWTATDACGNTATCTIVVTITSSVCPMVQDVDGNIYSTVAVGSTCWMASNLKTTHYADGREITNIYKYYYEGAPNVEENVSIYGLLYDWYDALDVARPTRSVRVQGICPDGWYLPNEDDFEQLNTIPATDLRSTNYWMTNPGTNASGYDLRPAGMFNHTTNRYENMHGNAYLWSASEINSTEAHCHMADCNCYMIYDLIYNKMNAFSVRCVKGE